MNKKIIRILLFAALAMLAACENSETVPEDVEVQLVRIEQESPIVVSVGETVEYSAVVKPDDATDKSVIWKSSDPTVATIDENGLARALKAGTVTITAQSSNQSITDECTLEVKQMVPATGVSIEPAKLSVGVGGQATVTAMIAPAGSTSTIASWESSDPDVATVTPQDEGKCRILGKAKGTATITVTTDNGKKAACEVTVIQTLPATGVSIEPAKLSVNVDEQATVTATLTPAGSTSTIASWESSDPDVATVTPLDDGECRISGKAKGTATVTVTTDNGKKAMCEVTVIQAIPATGISITPASVPVLKIGEKATLLGMMTPSNATSTMEWESSDPAVASIERISSTVCDVTAKGNGKAIITVTTDNGKKATREVTVSQPVTGIVLNRSSTTLELWRNNEDELIATVLPANAENREVTFTSSNSEVLFAYEHTNGKCKITARATGTVTVTATCGSYSASCTYTIKSTGENVYWMTNSGTLMLNGNRVWNFQSYIKPVAMGVKSGILYVACNDTQGGQVLLYRVNGTAVTLISNFDASGSALLPNEAYDIYVSENTPWVSVVGFSKSRNKAAYWTYNIPDNSSRAEYHFDSKTTYLCTERGTGGEFSMAMFHGGRRVNAMGRTEGIIVRSDNDTPSVWYATGWTSTGDDSNNYIQDMVFGNGYLYVAHNDMVLRISENQNVNQMGSYPSRILRIGVGYERYICLLENGDIYQNNALLYRRPGTTGLYVVGNDIYTCQPGEVYKNDVAVGTPYPPAFLTVVKL